MPSKGTPVVRIRIPRAIQEDAAREILLRNTWSTREPWDLSSFVREAIREFLRKRRASRRKPKRKKPEVPYVRVDHDGPGRPGKHVGPVDQVHEPKRLPSE